MLPNENELDKEPTFYQNEIHPVFASVPFAPHITVASDDCLDIAHEWVTEGLEVSVLNMANRRNLGGGVKGGAGAQEEYLIRAVIIIARFIALRNTPNNTAYSVHLISIRWIVISAAYTLPMLRRFAETN